MFNMKGTLSNSIELHLDDHVESDRVMLERGDVIWTEGGLLHIKGGGALYIEDIKNISIQAIFSKCSMYTQNLPTDAYFVGCLTSCVSLDNGLLLSTGEGVVLSNGLLLVETREIPSKYFGTLYCNCISLVERNL